MQVVRGLILNANVPSSLIFFAVAELDELCLLLLHNLCLQ
jgi:hypothetical protein